MIVRIRDDAPELWAQKNTRESGQVTRSERYWLSILENLKGVKVQAERHESNPDEIITAPVPHVVSLGVSLPDYLVEIIEE